MNAVFLMILAMSIAGTFSAALVGVICLVFRRSISAIWKYRMLTAALFVFMIPIGVAAGHFVSPVQSVSGAGFSVLSEAVSGAGFSILSEAAGAGQADDGWIETGQADADKSGKSEGAEGSAANSENSRHSVKNSQIVMSEDQLAGPAKIAYQNTLKIMERERSEEPGRATGSEKGRVSLIGQAAGNFSGIIAKILWIWGIGAGIFAAYQVFCLFRFRRRIRRTCLLVENEELLRVFDECLQAAGFPGGTEGRNLMQTGKIRLLSSDLVRTPMITGFFRICLILPEIEMSETEAKMIFAHELVHFKRKDLWRKAVVSLARSLHWFNPAIHLLAAGLDYFCELSCDAQVVREMNRREREAYGMMLLNLLDRARGRTGISRIALTDQKKGLKKRLSHMLHYEKGSKAAAVIAGTLVAVILSAGMLTGCAFFPVDSSENDGEGASSIKDVKSVTYTGYIACRGDMIQIDEAEFITENEKERMEELGLSETDMPYGYYIYNPSQEMRQFEIDDYASISYYGYDYDSGAKFQEIKTDEKSFYWRYEDNRESFLKFLYGDGDEPKRIPFEITTEDGVITAIKQNLGFSVFARSQETEAFTKNLSEQQKAEYYQQYVDIAEDIGENHPWDLIPASVAPMSEFEDYDWIEPEQFRRLLIYLSSSLRAESYSDPENKGVYATTDGLRTDKLVDIKLCDRPDYVFATLRMSASFDTQCNEVMQRQCFSRLTGAVSGKEDGRGTWEQLAKDSYSYEILNCGRECRVYVGGNYTIAGISLTCVTKGEFVCTESGNVL